MGKKRNLRLTREGSVETRENVISRFRRSPRVLGDKEEWKGLKRVVGVVIQSTQKPQAVFYLIIGSCQILIYKLPL